MQSDTVNLARKEAIPVNDLEIEGASVLYALRHSLHAGDLAATESLAPRAFELMRTSTAHCNHHRDWVSQLIGAGRYGLADASALAYLEYLKDSDQSTLNTQNRILYWLVY